MSGYLVMKRDRFRRLLNGEITVEEYVESVKRDVQERIRQDAERQRLANDLASTKAVPPSGGGGA